MTSPAAQQPIHSTSSGPGGHSGRAEHLGSPVPRLWTPPLRELTPETSYGYGVIEFADQVLAEPLDPWQQWAAIHLGELLPDGRPRFRIALILVARQQGKSHLARALTMYWMFIERWPLTLGLSSTLSYAKEQWQMVCNTATGNQWLNMELGHKPIRATIGEECLTTAAGARYKIAAANRRAGRSLTIDRIIADELREQHTWDAWDAARNAMNARRSAQLVAITNQGDDTSVVLDALRDPAIEYIETGVGDRRLGLFEWSCPPGSDPTDLSALAQSCPDLGGRTDPDALLGDAIRAVRAGGAELASFRTEVMCMRVALLDPAIDPDLWEAATNPTPLDLATVRDRVACCLDVSLDGCHASLVAAATVDGITHLDVVRDWSGPGCSAQVRRDLPDLIARIRPQTLGWFPTGPGAELAGDLEAGRRDGRRWPPRGVRLMPITTDTAAVCMALPTLIRSEVRHPGDEGLNAHAASAQRLHRSNGTWVYTRRGTGPVDGMYAAAGAVHLARTLPPPRAPLSVVRVGDTK